MADKPKHIGEKPSIENLDLDKEIVADLTEGEAEGAQVGALARGTAVPCGNCVPSPGTRVGCLVPNSNLCV